MPDTGASRVSYVPLRDDAARWTTASPVRTVLGVIHNVTSATRLLDLLEPFEGDPRVQVVFTCTGSSAFEAGIREFMTARELPCISWEMALGEKFDLAVSSSRGGELQKIDAPLVGAPHGAGYNKYLQRNRKPETGNRKPETGNRKPEAFGLDAEWLTHDGELIPSAIVLSHDEQRERLRRGCPEAVPRSVVAGDPCMDRLRASLPFREEYRAALGLRPGQKLLVLTSTWGPHSLLGANMDLVRRALAELPSDEYRVLAAVHPNVWYGHGGWQLRAWLAPFLRAGLILPSPDTDVWKAALVAADAFAGDHGSLTLYAAALGVPGLLGAFGEDVVAKDSPMDRLGAALARVAPDVPLERQLARAAAGRAGDERLDGIGALVTSRPMRSAELLRRLYYSRMELPEPEQPAVPRPVALPLPLPAERHGPVAPAAYADARSTADGGLELRRYPAALQDAVTGHLPDPHLVTAEGEPDSRWSRTADVVLARPPARGETFREAAERVFREHPGCWLAAFAGEQANSCVAFTRDGGRTTARWTGAAPPDPVAVAASALYALPDGDRVVVTVAGLPCVLERPAG
ncbi:hypothetical protein [Streptomyces griseocarneus]|uniref:CDP-Glycerol:Poly(Glycerophosphate) glycerophosphotransferase n=1 Tax=Streptomyces griseocarneus TaxID=51201 RepID=A0ABX7RJD5_9ACTN|nr:hypothetical protein [Streptomyces griseocarneus]QSY47536.1 hypothetical protein J3S04_19775 [Streptomyces griseocarneus]